MESRTGFVKTQRFFFKKSYITEVWNYLTVSDSESTTTKLDSNDKDLYIKVAKVILHLVFSIKTKKESFKIKNTNLIDKESFILKSVKYITIDILNSGEGYCLLRFRMLNGPENTQVFFPHELSKVFSSLNGKKQFFTSSNIGYIMGDTYSKQEDLAQEYLDEVYPLTLEMLSSDLKFTREPKIGNKKSGGYTKKSA